MTTTDLIINGTIIEDTFAEAFKAWYTQLIVTAPTQHWVEQAALASTGYATSVIGCGCEAGIEKYLTPEQTPDGRPGVSLLFFGGWNDLEKQLLGRIGQTIMTCPGTACYCNMEDTDGAVGIGSALRYFGDTFQTSKMIGKKRYWRIPVMDGEFIVEEKIPLQRAIAGGNFLILGKDNQTTLDATQRAVEAMKKVDGIIMPFPGGAVRSGSKVGSKYKFLHASSNTSYCPTIKPLVETNLTEEINCVLEIVIDGINEQVIAQAMKIGIQSACSPEIVRISAGNFGGNLGPFHFHLLDLFKKEEN